MTFWVFHLSAKVLKGFLMLLLQKKKTSKKMLTRRQEEMSMWAIFHPISPASSFSLPKLVLWKENPRKWMGEGKAEALEFAPGPFIYCIHPPRAKATSHTKLYKCGTPQHIHVFSSTLSSLTHGAKASHTQVPHHTYPHRDPFQQGLLQVNLWYICHSSLLSPNEGSLPG